ncbi:hypothetical protein AGMMS49921_07760 [Endomicrobiia bacterium]|nr:hypothetical protein AGMMS49921_07760 [Endomicrobiia bacterium]
MKNILAIIAMFVCTSICLGGNTKILDSSNATHGGSVAGNSDKLNGTMNEDLQVGARKGKIGAFYGFSKNELEYRPVLDIDTMAPIMSTAIGVWTVMEVVGKELTLEAFRRYQNNNERPSNPKASFKGGGLLAGYNLSKD